ncbi:MAG: PAS domain-containing sensor histidine kinase [Candidatus Bathyarchaeia archaeon]
MLFSKISEGIAYCQLITDQAGKPVDWVYLAVNEAYEKINGAKSKDVLGKRATEVLPNIQSDPSDWINLYGRVALTGESIVTERFSEARNKWYHVSAYSPQKGFFVAIFEDITERKRTEKELRKAKDDWERTFDAVPDFIALLDNNHRIIRANKAMAKQLGVTPKEVQGLICYECIHGSSCPPNSCPHSQLLKDGNQHTAEVYEPRLGGYFIVTATPLKDQKGRIIGSVHIARNITERRKAEEALKESELWWSTTLASIGDAVIATDREARITFMNPVAEALTGWTLKEAKQKPVKQVFHIINEQTREPVESPVDRVLKQGVIVGLANHTLLVCKDGTEVPIDDSGAPIIRDGQTLGVVLVFRDITERKKTEEAIHRQADLIDLSPDAIIVRKMNGTITFWNRGAEKLYGWTKKQAIGKTTQELFKTKYPQPFHDVIAELKEKQRWTGELIHKTQRGTEVVVQSWWLAEQTEHGEITSILESNVDLTERKKAEKEIARLASFPTLNPSPVIEVTGDGELTFINPATASIFPDLAELGLDHPFFCNWEEAKKRFNDKNTNTFGREVQVNGHWYHQQLYLVPYTQNIRIYSTEIDELKQTEEARARVQKKLEENAVVLEAYASQMEELAEQRAQELKSSERLAAIGQTAGMVGHDIRNPLQAITSDMYIIAEETKTMQDGESKQAILESVESVNQNLSYINKIVSDLQDYTRPLKPNLQDADLAELIEGTLLTISIPKGIEVSTKIDERAKPIRTDVAYMRRILTNLMTNAVQAMQEDGKLTVTATKKRSNIIIAVSDTGVGIPEEVQARMFTPLFTTKSKGQGLGLAVVKRLVEALGGTIRFNSQESKGTKFIVAFPQAK